jgi:hypothetical protein
MWSAAAAASADPPAVSRHNKKALPLSPGGSALFAGCTSMDLFTLPAKPSFFIQLFSHPFESWIYPVHPLEIFVLQNFGVRILPQHKVFKVKSASFLQFTEFSHPHDRRLRQVAFSLQNQVNLDAVN